MIDTTKRVSLIKRGIYYTADIIRPDGSDTKESGWLSPGWSRDTVYENWHEVSPDLFEAATDGEPRRWLADRLTDRLHTVDVDSTDGDGDGTVYSMEADEHPYTGVAVTVAAHIYGFEYWEIQSALAMIRDDRIRRDRIAREYMARTSVRAA